jgi:predicted HAD superfamily Cof-like phosphohydrolase
MSKSNYEKVKDFNEVFRIDIPQAPQPDLYTQNKSLVSLKLNLIKEEVNELETAIANNDLIETVDALADILYVVYGAGIAFGIDMDKAFDIVHQSNMTKACETEEIAQETVRQYQEQFKQGKSPYDSPTYCPMKDRFIVFNQSTGKILKSKNYVAAKFDSIL